MRTTANLRPRRGAACSVTKTRGHPSIQREGTTSYPTLPLATSRLREVPHLPSKVEATQAGGGGGRPLPLLLLVVPCLEYTDSPPPPAWLPP